MVDGNLPQSESLIATRIGNGLYITSKISRHTHTQRQTNAQRQDVNMSQVACGNFCIDLGVSSYLSGRNSCSKKEAGACFNITHLRWQVRAN